jgi:vacuolar iron transporter family protein
MPHPTSDHFQGKSVPEHLKEARKKGAMAAAELHGTEISGQKAAFADAAKDTALSASLLWLLISPLVAEKNRLLVMGLFLLGWILWKTCRSASFGWARLERLHRVIEEERWEIEHHREQERRELCELYQAKGFEDPLLTQVIDVLMADDNRLLQVMLEEELGLTLEGYEHPLKQAFGAFLGASFAALCGFFCCFFGSSAALFASLGGIFLAAGAFTAKVENIQMISSFIWNIAIFSLCLSFIYFLQQFFQ